MYVTTGLFHILILSKTSNKCKVSSKKDFIESHSANLFDLTRFFFFESSMFWCIKLFLFLKPTISIDASETSIRYHLTCWLWQRALSVQRLDLISLVIVMQRLVNRMIV